jgi:hypothetical protein
MQIAADLKLGEDVSKKEKTDIVSIINLLFYVCGRENCNRTIQTERAGKQTVQANISVRASETESGRGRWRHVTRGF